MGWRVHGFSGIDGFGHMTAADYRRNLEQLEAVASMFWPEEVSQQAASLSIIPMLLKTQDDFISILNVPIKDLGSIFTVLESSRLPANLFLKHLVILADFGGEMLQRINSQFPTLFPGGTLEYVWAGSNHTYTFRELPITGALNNNRLAISGSRLTEDIELSDLHRDVIALLLFGNTATDEYAAKVLSKCEIGDYLGRPEDLRTFIKQRYIWVSQITGGARNNNLGQIAQQVVEAFITEHIGIDHVTVQPNGHMPGVTHTAESDTRLTTFDLVVSHREKYAGVEVSFQVTTNSVIERKAGQAQARYQHIADAGYRIAYVLDGAGNFQRKTALQTILSYSHCSVAFSQSELEVLCDFLREYFASD